MKTTTQQATQWAPSQQAARTASPEFRECQNFQFQITSLGVAVAQEVKSIYINAIHYRLCSSLLKLWSKYEL